MERATADHVWRRGVDSTASLRNACKTKRNSVVESTLCGRTCSEIAHSTRAALGVRKRAIAEHVRRRGVDPTAPLRLHHCAARAKTRATM
eukprot:638106-Lingulodinium_polyedra.AAC.1